jgi:hypothetical protein
MYIHASIRVYDVSTCKKKILPPWVSELYTHACNHIYISCTYIHSSIRRKCRCSGLENHTHTHSHTYICTHTHTYDTPTHTHTALTQHAHTYTHTPWTPGYGRGEPLMHTYTHAYIHVRTHRPRTPVYGHSIRAASLSHGYQSTSAALENTSERCCWSCLLGIWLVSNMYVFSLSKYLSCVGKRERALLLELSSRHMARKYCVCVFVVDMARE